LYAAKVARSLSRVVSDESTQLTLFTATASLLISRIALGIVGVSFLGRVLVLEIAWLFLGFLFRYFGIHRLIHVSALNAV
jgi:hypothetical protein